MSDRIPGSTWDNPIWHGKWRIYLGDGWPEPDYAFTHDDYDGAPDAHDWRFGYGHTVDNCKTQINDYENEHG